MEFTLKKAIIIKHMLSKYTDVLLLDCDIIIINKITVDNSKQIGVSPGHIPENNIKEVGYYNAGYIWFSHEPAVDRWIQIRERALGTLNRHQLKSCQRSFLILNLKRTTTYSHGGCC